MNVDVVQKRLWEQSKQHREHRKSDSPLFPVDRYEGRHRNLMDLMHQPQWIAAACDRVLNRSRCQETSGKPDAWKLARPVWGWGLGEIPGPTPRAPDVPSRISGRSKARDALLAMFDETMAV